MTWINALRPRAIIFRISDGDPIPNFSIAARGSPGNPPAGASFSYGAAAIDEKIRTNTAVVLDQVQSNGVLPRAAALALARTRIERAMATRRWDH